MADNILMALYAERAVQAEEGYACPPDLWGGEYPSVFEVLGKMTWKGKRRTLGRLTMWLEPGRATVCLADRQSGQVCFYADVTITQALEGLERALVAGTADWRKDKKPRG